jgi:hypothetical protein
MLAIKEAKSKSETEPNATLLGERQSEMERCIKATARTSTIRNLWLKEVEMRRKTSV